jgi:uncharacterized protein YecE (DUF72 family)
MSRELPNVFCGPCGWSRIEHGSKQHPLVFLAEHFDAVEIPETFGEFLRPEVTRVWLRKVQSNPSFQFTAKLHRHFTHDRLLDPAEVNAFKDGLWPLVRAGRLGCVLMQFPWSFRYTAENRAFLIRLRRTFHEFPLAAEMRHSSWMLDEAVGTLIDYRVAFCNIDQPAYTRAMPPTAFLTSPVGYVRLHGRNAFNWYQDDRAPKQAHRYDYLYSDAELSEWRTRIQRVSGFATKTFVITNNDAGGKAIINGLQLQSMLHGGDGRDIPPDLLRRYPSRCQGALFSHYPGKAVA